jgi:hypothetical protein
LALFRSLTLGAPCPVHSDGTAFSRSLAFQHFRRRAPLGVCGVPIPARFRLLGLATHLTVSSDPAPSPVSFTGTALLGFRPSKNSPPADPAHLSICRYPPSVHGLGQQGEPCHPQPHRFQGLAPGRSPLTRGNTVTCPPCSVLPWAFPSPRTSTPDDKRAFTRSPFSE